MLRSIIFDLDDTLYAERDFVLSGYSAVAGWAHETLGLDPQYVRERLEQMLDEGVRGSLFDDLLVETGIESERWVPEMVRVYREHRPTLKGYPGVVELLGRLKERYSLGLLSDGYAGVQRRKLEALGIEPLLDAVMFTDELGREYWKPSPEGYRRLLEELGVERPEEAVYVGENCTKDFVGARGLGLRTIRVKNPPGFYTHIEPESADHAAEVDIEDLGELEDALERWARETGGGTFS
jgi:putative hydrolase of the HAD superfamily